MSCRPRPRDQTVLTDTLHLVGPFDAALAWASAPHCPLDLRALSLSPRCAFDMGGANARFAGVHGAGVRTLVVSLCDVWSVGALPRSRGRSNVMNVYTGERCRGGGGAGISRQYADAASYSGKGWGAASGAVVAGVRGSLAEVAVRKMGVGVIELWVEIWSADSGSYRRKEIHLDHCREVVSRLAVLQEERSLRRMDFVAVPDEEASQADVDRLQNWVEYALPKFAARKREHFIWECLGMRAQLGIEGQCGRIRTDNSLQVDGVTDAESNLTIVEH